jgi:hypothetical protein
MNREQIEAIIARVEKAQHAAANARRAAEDAARRADQARVAAQVAEDETATLAEDLGAVWAATPEETP